MFYQEYNNPSEYIPVTPLYQWKLFSSALISAIPYFCAQRWFFFPLQPTIYTKKTQHTSVLLMTIHSTKG